MTVYAIAQFSITDLTAYRRYQSRFADVFYAFDGTLLAADESPKVEEGSWPHQTDVPHFSNLIWPPTAGTHGFVRSRAA